MAELDVAKIQGKLETDRQELSKLSIEFGTNKARLRIIQQELLAIDDVEELPQQEKDKRKRPLSEEWDKRIAHNKEIQPLGIRIEKRIELYEELLGAVKT